LPSLPTLIVLFLPSPSTEYNDDAGIEEIINVMQAEHYLIIMTKDVIYKDIFFTLTIL
jgi:hypothetical protein